MSGIEYIKGVKFSERVGRITASVVFGLAERVARMNAGGAGIVDFTVGEPDFPTPDYITEAAKRAIDEGRTRYTATSGILPLRRAVARKLECDNGLKYTAEQIVVTNGCKHGLFNVLQTLVCEGDEVILFAPYWVSYVDMIKLCGGVPVAVPFGAESLRSAITPRTKLVLVNSPNNPTGAVYSKKELEQIAEVIEDAGIYVISDEIYEKLVYDASEHWSIARYSDKLYERTIVVNGFSKAYAMTGWRVGWTASSLKLARAMTAFQSHTTNNVNTPAQYAALTALEDARGDEVLGKMVAEFAKRAEYMTKRLSSMGNLVFTKPQGAFYVLIDVSGFGKAADVSERLLSDAAIAVVPCELFGAEGFVRLSYALSMSEIETGMDRLEKWIISQNPLTKIIRI